MASVHVAIVGRVQGVGYRAWCARHAAGLGLSGWVRNRSTGEVEAVFCGPEESVTAMLEAAREGPGWARVERIDELGAASPCEGPFEVLDTV